MTSNGWLQIFLFFAAVLAVTKPLGIFLWRVFEGKSTWLDPVLRPVEKLIYRICGVNASKEMHWREYGVAMLTFSGISLLILYLIERVQHWLPWNPQNLANVPGDLAWNTAVSFTTNTTNAGNGYDTNASSASNLGPTNKQLSERVHADVLKLQQENPGQPIPIDLVTASGSGLDPDISPASAAFQVPRIATTRNITSAQVNTLILRHQQPRQFGILGEPRVNVLELNLDLDANYPIAH